MPQITLSMIVTLIGLALKSVKSIVRVIGTIMDIADDGCLNNSVERPEWYERLLNISCILESIGHSLTEVRSDIVEPKTKEDVNN